MMQTAGTSPRFSSFVGSSRRICEAMFFAATWAMSRRGSRSSHPDRVRAGPGRHRRGDPHGIDVGVLRGRFLRRRVPLCAERGRWRPATRPHRPTRRCTPSTRRRPSMDQDAARERQSRRTGRSDREPSVGRLMRKLDSSIRRRVRRALEDESRADDRCARRTTSIGPDGPASGEPRRAIRDASCVSLPRPTPTFGVTWRSSACPPGSAEIRSPTTRRRSRRGPSPPYRGCTPRGRDRDLDRRTPFRPGRSVRRTSRHRRA
jgi:hypothetical protein